MRDHLQIICSIDEVEKASGSSFFRHLLNRNQQKQEDTNFIEQIIIYALLWSI